MALKAADLAKKKTGKGAKTSKSDALLNWIGGRRGAVKKSVAKVAKKGDDDGEDEE